MPKDDWPEKIERAVREALKRVPGLDNLVETDYCAVVLEGLDLIATGIETRLDELERDDDDDLDPEDEDEE